jgi:hypothetical protein
MKKFFKALLLIGGTALAAHFGMKTYKKINGTVKLSKSLPEFLNNVYGEMPKVNISQNLNSTNIKVFFSQEIIDKHSDIDTTVREYVDDFYPDLAKSSVDISVQVKSEETEEETEDTTAETTEEKE